jgi:hypothetical protein
MAKVSGIYEQLTIVGGVEYMVCYTDGKVEFYKDYPTEEVLANGHRTRNTVAHRTNHRSSDLSS